MSFIKKFVTDRMQGVQICCSPIMNLWGRCMIILAGISPIATDVHAGQTLPNICSQRSNPSLRGHSGTHLCPLVLAPLRASEGELTRRISARYSPATTVTLAAPLHSLPLFTHSAARNPKHTWAAGLAVRARLLAGVGTSAVKDLQRWLHSSAQSGHRSHVVRINTLHH